MVKPSRNLPRITIITLFLLSAYVHLFIYLCKMKKLVLSFCSENVHVCSEQHCMLQNPLQSFTASPSIISKLLFASAYLLILHEWCGRNSLKTDNAKKCIQALRPPYNTQCSSILELLTGNPLRPTTCSESLRFFRIFSMRSSALWRSFKARPVLWEYLIMSYDKNKYTTIRYYSIKQFPFLHNCHASSI